MENKYEIRPLDEDDIDAVNELDLLSGNNVIDMLDCDGYAHGLFADGQLIAYCTVGGADGCDSMLIEGHPCYDMDSLLLSDVFVLPEHRGNGVADAMLDHVLNEISPNGEPSVFLQLLDDNLSILYSRHGFEWCDDSRCYCMVRDERTVRRA